VERDSAEGALCGGCSQVVVLPGRGLRGSVMGSGLDCSLRFGDTMMVAGLEHGSYSKAQQQPQRQQRQQSH
ncbi:unnamed protein product, partial [Polarella glacialis]